MHLRLQHHHWSSAPTRQDKCVFQTHPVTPGGILHLRGSSGVGLIVTHEGGATRRVLKCGPGVTELHGLMPGQDCPVGHSLRRRRGPSKCQSSPRSTCTLGTHPDPGQSPIQSQLRMHPNTSGTQQTCAAWHPRVQLESPTGPSHT